jgi:hypothetical protein
MMPRGAGSSIEILNDDCITLISRIDVKDISLDFA